MSITFYYFGLRFSKPEQAVICLHSHPIRPGPDSHFLGLKRLGFGQRLHVKSHEERPLWPLLSRKFHTFDQCPIAKAMSSLRQVGTAALSRPRCLRAVQTLEGCVSTHADRTFSKRYQVSPGLAYSAT